MLKDKFAKWKVFGITIPFHFLNFMTWYAFTLAICFLAWIVLLGQTGKLAESTSQVMIAMVGLIGTISGFIWGSAVGSKQKDAVIDEMKKTQQTPTAAISNVEQLNVAGDKAGDQMQPIGFRKPE